MPKQPAHQRESSGVRSWRALVLVLLAAAAVIIPAAPASAAAPGAPVLTALVAGPGPGKMTVRWLAPTDNGGVRISSYEYEATVDGAPFVGSVATLATGTARSAIIDCPAPATPGHGCGVRIRANNGTPSPYSASLSTQWSAPGAPSFRLLDAGPGLGEMTAIWWPPRATGGLPLTSFEYRVAVDGGPFSAPVAIPGTGTTRKAVFPCGAPALAGHGCSYQVRALNGIASTTNWSAPRTTLWGRPTAPLFRSATAGNAAGSATLSWRAPRTTGGLPITYSVDTNNGAWLGPVAIDMGSVTQTPSASGTIYSTSVPCPLTAGTDIGCLYRLRAGNDVGTGLFSPTRLAVLTAPKRLNSTIATTGSVLLGTGVAQQTASWSPPTSTGGLAITSYEIAMCAQTPGALCGGNSPYWSTITPTSLSASSLQSAQSCPANGRCWYRMRAINAKGAGPWRMTASKPAPPASAIAVPLPGGSASLSWVATPGFGSVLGNYVVFACDTTVATCTNGAWTNNAADLAPWTRTNVPVTSTTTTMSCPAGHVCAFRVGYVDGLGNIGGVSNSATTQSLDAPTLFAGSGSAAGSVRLTYSPPATGGTVTGYQIEKQNGLAWEALATVPVTPTNYTDNNCGPNVVCSYRIRALYSPGQSADSAVATALGAEETPLAITAPTAGTRTNDTTPTFSGTALSAAAAGTNVAVEVHAGSTTAGALVQTANATRTGATWSTTATALTNGIYTAVATQLDAASATVTSTAVTFTIDTIAPIVGVTSVNGSPATFPHWRTTPATVFGGICGNDPTDDPTVSVTIFGPNAQNGTAPCVTGAWTYTPSTPLGEGAHVVSVSQIDTAGNSGSSGLNNLNVDTTPPVVSLTTVNGAAVTFPHSRNTIVTTIGGACGTLSGDGVVAVSVSGPTSENGTTPCTSGTWNFTLTTPLSGTGTYAATATQSDQAANNGTSGAKAITLDTSTPAVSVTSVNGSAAIFPHSRNTAWTAVGGTCGTATGDATTVSVAIGGAATEIGSASCNTGTWSYILVTPLSTAAAYNVAASQLDAAGNTGSSGTNVITIDMSAPVVAVTTVNGAAATFPQSRNTVVTAVGGTCGTLAGDDTSVSVAMGGGATENGSASCVAGAWNYTLVAPRSNGNHTVAVSQGDAAGNTGTSATNAIFVDVSAPAVTLTTVNGSAASFPQTRSTPMTSVGGACGTGAGDNSTVAVSVTGSATENGSASCNAGTWSYTLVAPLGNGAYSVTATQGDNVGNIGTSGAKSITVDTNPPAVNVTTVNGGAVTFPHSRNTSVTTVGGTCDTGADDVPSVDVTVTGGAGENATVPCATGTWTYTLVTPLAPGSYTVSAIQVDSQLNVGTSGSKVIIVDQSAPAVNITTVNGSAATFPLSRNAAVTALGGTCGTGTGDNSTVNISVGGSSAQNGSASCVGGTWSFTLSPSLADGNYVASATQGDLAGNTGSSGLKTLSVDTVAPVLTLTTVNGNATTFPNTRNSIVSTVGGACGTANGDNGTVSLAITGGATENGSASCTAGTWSYTLVGPLGVGTYSITATQGDLVGNTGTSGAKSVTVDTTPPSVSITTLNGSPVSFPHSRSSNATAIAGTCTNGAGDNATVSITVTGVGAQSGTAPCAAGAWSFTFAPALANGDHSITVTQGDAAGNVSTTGPHSVSIDTAAPAITLASVNGNAATFPHARNTSATSIGGACGTAAGDNNTVSVAISGGATENGSASCNAGTWSYTLVAPLGVGVYSVTATQSDAAANTGTTGAQSISVDATAPTVNVSSVNLTGVTFPHGRNNSATVIGGTCGSGTGDNATVTIDITGSATRNGTSPCGPTGWLFSLNPALGNGTYFITVTQGDAAGNTGSSGAQVLMVDLVAPLVSVTQVNGSAVTFPFFLNVNANTAGGTCGTVGGDIASVTVDVLGTAIRHAVVPCTAGTWTYTFAAPLTLNGPYTITAQQSDSVGNSTTTPAQSLTIDRTAPTVAVTRVDGNIVTFPFSTGLTVTTVGGTCSSGAGDLATVSVAITSAGSQNGTAPCSAGSWTLTLSPSLTAVGAYQVTAMQSDAATNVGSSPTVTINRT